MWHKTESETVLKKCIRDFGEWKIVKFMNFRRRWQQTFWNYRKKTSAGHTCGCIRLAKVLQQTIEKSQIVGFVRSIYQRCFANWQKAQFFETAHTSYLLDRMFGKITSAQFSCYHMLPFYHSCIYRCGWFWKQKLSLNCHISVFLIFGI